MNRVLILLTTVMTLACTIPLAAAEGRRRAAGGPRGRGPTFNQHREQGLPADIATEADRDWYQKVAADSRKTAWLGIELGRVPEAVDVQLRLSGRGLMVLNVFRDSPADKAGLDRYDVIIKADADLVTEGPKAFAKFVRGKKPGALVRLEVYHQGEKKEVSVELAHRPGPWTGLEPKYDDNPDGFVPQKSVRGKIYRFGPDGWKLEDLGEIPELQGLYHHYLHPEIHTPADDGEVDQVRRVDKDGRSLHVRRNDDGSVVVERGRSEDGKEKVEVKTYKSLDELKQADPEAHELLQSARSGPSVSRHLKEALQAYREAWRRYQDALREHAEALRKQGHPHPGFGGDDRWREWSEQFFQGPLKDGKHLQQFNNLVPPGADPLESAPAPGLRFEVLPDGQITVHLRNEQGELSRTFESEEVFEENAPELHAQFERLQKQVR